MPVEAAAAAVEAANTSFGENDEIGIHSGLAAGLGTTCNGPMIMIASYRVRTRSFRDLEASLEICEIVET